jgi:sterol desaturase/sphingolipid hydroxylase (fatty acid hydroxylase superfamily)
MVSLELLFPKGPQPSNEERLRGLVFLLILTACSAVIARVLQTAYGALHLRPLFTVILPPMPPVAEFVVATLIGWLLLDFAFYLRHRLQHIVAWRFHAIHHSIERLSSASSYNHWTEAAFAFAFATLPLSLLVGSPSTVLVAALFTIQTNYLHTATALHFGWFRRILADNRYHRIHHSREARHYGKNFAACFPFWDVIFGTAYFPADDEWPATGLDAQREPVTLGEYLTRPFRSTAATLR